MEIHDPLTYPQIIAIYDAVDEIESLEKKNGKGKLPAVRTRSIWLPSLIGCVAKWNLEGFPKKVTEKNFPASPLIASGEVIDWIQSEVIQLMTEAKEVPNES